MTNPRVVDEPLRVRALDALGPLGDELAHEVLETANVEVEHNVLAWEGSHGSIQARERIVDGCRRQIHDRDKNFCSRCIRFNFDNALLALSFYRDGGDWTSGKIAMRSPRTEPSQSSLAT